MTTMGRNTLCPCGSTKKYKHCCGNDGNSYVREPSTLQLGTDSKAIEDLDILRQATLLFRQGKELDAERHLRNLLQEKPKNIEAMDLLSLIFIKNSRWEEAIALLQQGISIAPFYENFLNKLSIALYVSGWKSEGMECARRLLELYPNSPYASQFLPIFRVLESGHNKQLLEEVTERYARTAADYEEGRQRTNFTTPKQLLDEVTALLPVPLGRVLDLGCGTGLAGETFREHASFLAGVDASKEMLQRARGKGIFDQLELIGILEFLQATEADSWDAIYASSVFLYFGSFAEIFKYSQRALKAGGVLTFDLLTEKVPSGGFSVATVDGMYFEHDPDFVVNQAKDAGLTLVRQKAQTFQYIEAGVESPGYIFTFRKSVS